MIRFRKDIKPIELEKRANLMRTLLNAGLPVASSCYGKGICSKCRVQVLKGMENLTPETEQEKILKTNNKLGQDIRISCQISVLGDIEIDTPYW